MPHDVIMPALGMAQDSGVLVAWLKGPGDPVKAGDGLMEVETDKATMEVEAEADGYLTDIRVQAGESAPVGKVVAVIADAPEAEKPQAPGPNDAGRPDDPPDDAPEGTPVIMPALGMAQDSGKIIAWAKAPGDAVAADDTLFEVETDKAAMEVPAGTDGFLAGCFVEAGDSAPVGTVIAMITATRSRAPTAPPAAQPAPKAGETDTGHAATQAVPDPAKATPEPAPPTPAGRILASPKARRLARERGIDLAALTGAGVAQPIHAADLDRVPAPQAAPPASHVPASAAPAQRASAEVESDPFTAFLDWMARETGDTDGEARRAAVLAAFAAGALRAATGSGGGIAVSGGPGTAAQCFADPDRHPLGAVAPGEAAVALHLRDLTRTAVTAVDLAAVDAPVLSLSRRGDRLRLDYSGTLPPDHAIALLDGVAARLADPLRHIL